MLQSAIEHFSEAAYRGCFIRLQDARFPAGGSGERIELRIQDPNGDLQGHPLLLEIDGDPDRRVLTVKIPGIAYTSQALLLSRTAHVNHMVRFAKMGWDPESREVFVTWEFFLAEADDLGAVPGWSSFDVVVSSMLYVFFNERVFFLKSRLDEMVGEATLTDGQRNAVLDEVVNRVDSQLLPLLKGLAPVEDGYRGEGV